MKQCLKKAKNLLQKVKRVGCSQICCLYLYQIHVYLYQVLEGKQNGASIMHSK